MRQVLSIIVSAIVATFFIGCATISNRDLEIYHNKIEIGNTVTAIQKAHGIPVQEPNKEKIQIHYDGEVVQEMTLEEFETLVGDATIYNDILSAERDKRVYVQLKDKVWKMQPGQKFQTEIYILWQTKDKKIMRKMTLKVELTIAKEGGMSKWRILYRDVAEIMLPISLSFNIIMILLLVLLL